jgi:hypothetical protein
MRDQMDATGPVDHIVVELPDTKVPKDGQDPRDTA